MHKLINVTLLWCLILPYAWSGTQTSLPAENFKGEQKLSSILSSKRFITTGEATFSILFWDLYKSQLRTTSGRYPISLKEEQLIFNINYLADISSEDLIKRTIEQWQHQDISKETYTHYIKQLKNIWPNITKGDSLAILIKNDKSVFYFNGQYIGGINDDIFGQLFINIWLDKKTSQPTLRAQLLGANLNE
ncbi:chalcone isomerase family protein [Litorilituus lipolyticus]|uniref:Chalcone isomerase domain-containing protein n=1 Tax=Litorilituus lipolyticus TaxID=2491017 RepID=A0A502KLI1_9GAMM|nr:chalcone isomerase family protein [Litorilituus lipolyticus]TPH12094.1 hypothetical protein EPA86_17205 [Litorilituus lipolyticus]